MIQTTETATQQAARAEARRFGQMLRRRRAELKLRQDDVALTTGLGRRFIIELEAGKPTAQLGKALLVAQALGLRLFNVLQSGSDARAALLPDLDDLPALDGDDD